MQTQQRFLDFAYRLPTDATDRMLARALDRWNPGLVDGTRSKVMSQLRLLTDDRVRRHWQAIYAIAKADPTPRFVAKFLALAARVRDGEKL